MHQKNIINLTIKKLIGEASAGELLILKNLVEADPANELFVNILTGYFNEKEENDHVNNARLFKRVKEKMGVSNK
jgi:hypothetical protein